jgi:hypothetical protein
MPVVETHPVDIPPGSVRYSPHRKMFLCANKRFKDGKEHRYWSVVENRRLAGVSRTPEIGPVVKL